MMPIYTYRCHECGFEADEYRKVAERHASPTCLCGGYTVLRIMPTMMAPDIPEYESPVTGKPVRGRRQRADDLARSDCRPYEGREQEQKEADKRAAELEAKANARLEAQAHEVFNGLPAAAQRTLEGM